MSNDRADAAVIAHTEAVQRFDYFVTGGAGTVLAYAVQSYDPSKTPQAAGVAILSWAFLLAAVGLGLLHLSVTVEAMRLTPIALDLHDMADTIREAQYKNVGVFMAGAGVAATNPVQLQQALEMMQTEIESATNDLGKSSRRKRWLGRVRNGALFAGLLALAVWKVGNL